MYLKFFQVKLFERAPMLQTYKILCRYFASLQHSWFLHIYIIHNPCSHTTVREMITNFSTGKVLTKIKTMVKCHSGRWIERKKIRVVSFSWTLSAQ